MSTQPPKAELIVTEVGEFISHRSCERRFKLAFNKRAEARSLPFWEGLFSPMDPVLQIEGKRREGLWEDALRAEGLTPLCVRTGDEEQATWAEFLEEASHLPIGQPAYAREVRITGQIGDFTVTGRIDFCVVTWVSGTPRIRMVECKASRKDQTYQRIQVALYAVLARSSLVDAQIAGFAIRPDDIDAVVARIDEETNKSQDILALEPLDLAQESDDVERLLAADGALRRITQTPLDELEYQLDPKCDTCVFNLICYPESARLRRLQLTGIEPSAVRTLRAAGVADIDALADLDLAGPQAAAVRGTAGFTYSLAALKQRAHARRSTLPGGDHPDTYPVEPLPNFPASQLPQHSVDGHPVVRVYLTVHFDYVENRIGALSAHVTKSDGQLHTRWKEDGTGPDPEILERPVVEVNHHTGAATFGNEYRPAQGRTISRFKATPWSGNYADDSQEEGDLLQGFLRDLVSAIEQVAGVAEAPIHFFVWSRSEMARLVEACSRVQTNLLGHLRELLGCREPLDQLIFSCLEDEVRNRYALGWTARGLAVVTSLSWFGRRFYWNRLVDGNDVNIERVFVQDIFDFKTDLWLDESNNWTQRDAPGGTSHKFEIRSRFYDTLPAPYWRAVWGTLPDPDTVSDRKLAEAIRRYNRAAEPGVFAAYLEARALALRWVEDAIIFKNQEIRKPLLSIPDLSQFDLGVNSTARAAIDFLRLDQHVAVTDWIAAHLVPPGYRLPSGRTLPIANVRCTGTNRLAARVDLSNYDMSETVLQDICTIQEGSFVRFTPADANPNKGQTVGQLLRLGSTCIVDRLDWSSGEVELSVIPSRAGDPYTLQSYTYRTEGDVWPFATLDESATDFIAGRVERRLQQLGGHPVCTWLDPTHPVIPAEAPLETNRLDQLTATARAVRLPDGLPLAPEQIEAALEGLNSRIQLLQGPPGTGKTMTTAAAVLLRIAARCHPGDVVLVTANTHTAVNNVLDRIEKLKPVFSRAATECGLHMPTVSLAKIESSDSTTPPSMPMAVINGSRMTLRQFDRLAAGGIAIMGGTTGALLKMAGKLDDAARFGQHPGGFQARLLIVDEASMMVFPHFLALGTLTRPDGEIMLAGDHRQLAPIMSHDWEQEDRPPIVLYQPYTSAYEAVRSIALRAETPVAQIRLSALRYSFRLPALIRELIGNLYRLDHIELDGRCATERPAVVPGVPIWKEVWQDPGGLFLVVHDERSSTHINRTESEIIAKLLEAGVPQTADSIAVVTPHRAQRNLLNQELSAYCGIGAPVGIIDTVERLQGGERPTIIVSATESDPSSIASRAEFILSLNRANVAFSRPKERLIVVCAKSLLDHIPPDIENYEATMLWKSMRALCSESLGSATIGAHGVTIFTPPHEVRLLAESGDTALAVA